MLGDFTGFSFDNIHSSDLGIIRVSSGDRYDESLLPDFEDSVSDVKGINGQYYFGTQIQPKHFEISIAFDHMTEYQFRQLRRLLSIKVPRPLIFDERPYKQYTAKIESVPELSYICFDEPHKYSDSNVTGEGVRVIARTPVEEEVDGETVVTGYTITRETVYPWQYEKNSQDELVYERIYKGEGKIDFICYYPFARAPFKILDLYGDFDFRNFDMNGPSDFIYYKNNPRPIKSQAGNWLVSNDGIDDYSEQYVDYGNPYTIYTNVNEWARSSYIMPYVVYTQNNIDKVIESTNPAFSCMIPVYNAGDIDAPFNLFIPYTADSDNSKGTINPADGNEYIIIDMGLYQNTLVLKPIESKKNYSQENGIMINTRNHLIEGVKYDKQQGKWETTGELYNEFIVRGDFGKIDRSAYYPINSLTQAIYLSIADENIEDIQIHYSYLYY